MQEEALGTRLIINLIFEKLYSFIRTIFLFLDTRGEKRSIWVKPGRTEKWWENLSSGKMCAQKWKDNFRMSRENFQELVKLIQPYAKKKIL